MRGYLLDTNHLSHAIRTVSALRDRLRQAHRQGFRLVVCWPVLCELEEGIVFTADPAQYRRTLKTVMKEVRIWEMDWPLVEHYGAVVRLAKERGRVLSTTDMILAGFAWRENITLLTADKDFAAFPEIKTENWIADV
jgi:predicted nucleic acid-binding protein